MCQLQVSAVELVQNQFYLLFLEQGNVGEEPLDIFALALFLTTFLNSLFCLGVPKKFHIQGSGSNFGFINSENNGSQAEVVLPLHTTPDCGDRNKIQGNNANVINSMYKIVQSVTRI